MAPEESSAEGQREAYISEARRIADRHQGWADAQRTQAAWWRRWNTWISATVAILAGVSGGVSLSSSNLGVIAGVAALSAAVLTGMASAFGSSARSEESFTAATANQVLADRAETFIAAIAPYEPLEDVRRAFDDLRVRQEEVTTNAHLKLGVRASGLFQGTRRPTKLDEVFGNQHRRDSAT
ncbi:hypothetical protein [Actinophytocola sp.]|uniref:hypothetical protein n=1 Tax=Actinophytocola sp. TaxID=1872138 RepID=UPI002ED4D285